MQLTSDKETLDRLEKSNVVKTIQIEENFKLGLDHDNNDFDTFYKITSERYDKLINILQGAKLVFILAGLGGNTGSGMSVLIANFARKVGAITIAILTTSFVFEGEQRKKKDCTKNL